MEYYTKSEGLGFLIRKSRIDFRIEFRGVSILFEFNSLIWLVSHDHHQTVRYGEEAGVSTADSTFSNSNGHKWPHDGATDNPALSGWRWLKQYDCLNFTDGQAAKSDTPDTKIRSNEQRGVFNLTQVTEDVSLQGSCILPSRKLSILHGPVWPTKKLRTVRYDQQKNCERSGMTHTKTVLVNHWSQLQNGAIRPRRSQQWFDKRSKRTFIQNLHNFNPRFRFFPIGPRPLYSFLGSEESRIFGSC